MTSYETFDVVQLNEDFTSSIPVFYRLLETHKISRLSQLTRSPCKHRASKPQ